MGIFSEVLLGNADKVLDACKRINYNGIINHDPSDVATLKEVLVDLSITANQPGESQSKPSESADGSVTNQVERGEQLNSGAGVVMESKEDIMARRENIAKHLDDEGFAERIGNVYNSFAEKRISTLDQIPHRRGLPPFDVVIAPDFAPVAGLHGVFISEKDVMSIILASEGGGESGWEIIKQKPYKTPEEMIELVTLVAAGFDLP